MFKKLLALAAVASLGLGSQAAKLVEDMYVDWTQRSWNSYVMGYIPQTSAEEGLIFEWPNFTYQKVEDDGANPNGYETVTINGELNYIVPTEDGGPMESWGIQAHLLPENLQTEVGTKHTITIYAKANKDGVNIGLPLSWDWSGGTCNGNVTVNSEWEEISFEYEEVGGASCWCVCQMYDNEARVAIKWVKITHMEGGSDVDLTEWEDCLVNGDAEGEYGEVPCAYSKEYKGRGADGSETASPEPSAIETVDGSKVFVCHAKTVDPNEFPAVFINDDGTVKGDPQWQNQFWIQSPKAWNTNDQFRLSFRYKADKAASTDTQAHGETPGGYLHWNMVGSINFAPEWQQFSKTVTVESAANNMWSVAFNLKEYTMDNNYYFDDMKWETMKLDEGYFIAGDFQEGSDGQFFDYAHAVEMVFNNDENAYCATVGTEARLAETIQISTVRGNDTAFKTNTIKPLADFDAADAASEDGDWKSYEAKAAAKITLPVPGVWTIMIDEESGEMGAYVGNSGINSPMFDLNAPIYYYNLQGVQVNNPVKGNIYILKQGNKAMKVLVR